MQAHLYSCKNASISLFFLDVSLLCIFHRFCALNLLRSHGSFWNRRTGLEKGLLAALGVCGVVLLAGGSFYAMKVRNSSEGKGIFLDTTTMIVASTDKYLQRTC